jgi:hypothetical protein
MPYAASFTTVHLILAQMGLLPCVRQETVERREICPGSPFLEVACRAQGRQFLGDCDINKLIEGRPFLRRHFFRLGFEGCQQAKGIVTCPRHQGLVSRRRTSTGVSTSSWNCLASGRKS